MEPRLLHLFSTFAPGGPQVRTARLVNAMGGELVHAVTAMDGCLDARGLVDPGLGVRFLERPPASGALASVRALVGLLRAERPDLLLTYNWGAIEAVAASRLAGGLPVLHHEDGFGPDEARSFKRRRVLARRLLLPRTAGVIVPSFTLESIATGTWRLDPAHVRRIANGIELDDFAPADGNPALRDALGIPADAFVLGSVGHLRREKNPVRLVDALGVVQDPRVHLLALGDGPERAAVERRVQELGIGARVHLVGHREHPGGHYRAMDAFALSSDTEQMPVALLEAMASRLPVAATDVGDVARMLPDSQGELVVPAEEPGTAERLAAAIARLAADGALAARLGTENRDRVRADFTFDGMLAAYRDAYGTALGAEQRT